VLLTKSLPSVIWHGFHITPEVAGEKRPPIDNDFFGNAVQIDSLSSPSRQSISQWHPVTAAAAVLRQPPKLGVDGLAKNVSASAETKTVETAAIPAVIEVNEVISIDPNVLLLKIVTDDERNVKPLESVRVALHSELTPLVRAEQAQPQLPHPPAGQRAAEDLRQHQHPWQSIPEATPEAKMHYSEKTLGQDHRYLLGQLKWLPSYVLQKTRLHYLARGFVPDDNSLEQRPSQLFTSQIESATTRLQNESEAIIRNAQQALQGELQLVLGHVRQHGGMLDAMDTSVRELNQRTHMVEQEQQQMRHEVERIQSQ
ncbi:unnamed protein product, partial [Prorocentrum cordatum]